MEKLLDYFIPQKYNLCLDINKDTEEVHGHVEITGKQLAPVVKFHAENMTINRVVITPSLQDDNHEYLEFTHENDILTLPPLKPHRNPLNVEIDFHYKIGHTMEGVYLSTYQYEGKEERIVTTQFESHYARRAFPSIDEPAAKAVFELTICTDASDTVISNMPVAKSEVIEGSGIKSQESAKKTSTSVKSFTFLPTPRMSTYLLAFCIGKFRGKTVTSQHGVKVTTYCPLNHPDSSVDFANEIAAKSLDYYDELFGIKYPLEKLDQVAIPDFEAGAMENWGLVTYREQCLLADRLTSSDQKEYIATVIAHELSHQWFGDLVTMKWWDDLWLNESFATVMEYLCVDAIHPEYQIMQDFFTGECLAALNRDCLPGVQAVRQEVHDPAEIPTLFDGAIVYAKGARLMLMLIRLMTPRRFFAGIKDYFKKYQYENTVGDDLWSSLQPHADFDVKEFMHTWISQPGYPVITDGVQERFLINGSSDNSKWPAPAKKRNADDDQVDSDTSWPIPEIKDDMSGHYLINLSGPEFKEALDDFDNLSLEQRLRLLIDRNLLSMTPLVSSASLLDVVPKFRNETSEPVWSILTTILGNLRFFCPDNSPKGSEIARLYKQFVRKSIDVQYSALTVNGKAGESANEIKLRQIILGWAIYSEYSAYLKEISAEYNADLTKITPDTRAAIIRAYYRLHEEDDLDRVGQEVSPLFQTLLSTYQSAASPDLKGDLRATLCSSRTKKHIKYLEKLLKEPDIIKPQDHLYFYVGLLRNPYTRDMALDWLYHNWDYLVEMTGDKSLEDYPRIVASALRTQDEADQFFDFFAPHLNNPALRRTIEVARPQVSANLRRLQLDTPAVHRRLRELMS